MNRSQYLRNLFCVYAAMLAALGAGVSAYAVRHRTLPLPVQPTRANLGWGHCTPRAAPTCDEGTTCPDGSCAACYQLPDGTYSCCCPFH